MKHWSELPNVKKSFEQSLFEQSEYPQEGSSYWRITEIFREKLEADSAGKVFNDQYAHGLSLSLASELNKQRRLVLYGFIAFIILVLSITGNNLPLSFPYIGDLSANQQIPRGLYEVTFYAFLLVTGLLYKSRIRSSTYEKLLRVYADFRHGANNRDLYLLRWNIDDVTPHIVSEEYDGYVRKGERGLAFKVLLAAMTRTLVFLTIAQLAVVVLGTAIIVQRPTLGWLSFILLAGTLIFFVANLIVLGASLRVDAYAAKY